MAAPPAIASAPPGLETRKYCSWLRTLATKGSWCFSPDQGHLALMMFATVRWASFNFSWKQAQHANAQR
eukprot:9129316-Alexandrium_andersonii.AAC.1